MRQLIFAFGMLAVLSGCRPETLEDASARPEFAPFLGKRVQLRHDAIATGVTFDRNYRGEMSTVDGKPGLPDVLAAEQRLSGPESTVPVEDGQLAAMLLDAIRHRDGGTLRRIVNNPALSDDESLRALIDPAWSFREMRSAQALLAGDDVQTQVRSSTTPDGKRSIDIVYLPAGGIRDFAQLRKAAAAGTALPFRDYVACSVIERRDGLYMQNLCYAETDALE